MKFLPKKPSKLIRLAIADLVKTEQDSNYKIHMDTWHVPFHSRCHVCLAGAVMAQTLGADITKDVVPADFSHVLKVIPTRTWLRLRALDCFRKGHVSEGLRFMGYGDDTVQNCDDIRAPGLSYSDEPTAFKENLLLIADQFERKGL
jgi:hypothetical protein